MISQKLNILPDGPIHGGTINLRIDENSGMVDYTANVYGKKYFVPFNRTFTGQKKVDIKLLESEGKHQGSEIQVGDFVLEVASVENKIAHCEMSLALGNQVAKGSAAVDLGAKYVRILNIEARASVPVLGIIRLVAKV